MARGNYAYMVTDYQNNGAFVVMDITNAMTEPPTVVPPTTGQTSISGSQTLYNAVTAYGSYAFTSAAREVNAYDISTPLSPVKVRSVPFSSTNSYCQNYAPRGGITVAGSRVYVTGLTGLKVLELE